MKRRFTQVDVFTAIPLKGNPLAVVHDADGLDDAQMQAFANWTNLSETTFLLQPTDPAADYRVRIFTPNGEFKFAGHPTLGSCHAWLQAGGAPKDAARVVQQCGVGLVDIRRDNAGLAFAAPPLARETVDAETLARALRALGLDASRVRAASWLDNGTRWIGLMLDSANTVLAIRPDHAALKTLAKVGVIGPHPDGDADFEVRAFAAANDIPEDPVTGGLNASLAQWLIGAGMAPSRYGVSQGTAIGRAGRVQVEQVGAEVWIGGASVTCVEGSVSF